MATYTQEGLAAVLGIPTAKAGWVINRLVQRGLATVTVPDDGTSYVAQIDENVPLSAYKSISGEYTTPSPTDVKRFLTQNDLTGAVAANVAYLSGDQAIRKYTGGAKPYQMSGAVWFTLHARLMLDEETLQRIYDAMENDAHGC